MPDSIGVRESLQRMVDTLLSIIQTRVELLSTEIEEERVRIGQLLLYGAFAFIFFAMSVLLLTFLVVAAFWDNHPLLVLSGLIALFLMAGARAWFSFRKVAQSRFVLFSSSLSALAEDRTDLGPRA